MKHKSFLPLVLLLIISVMGQTLSAQTVRSFTLQECIEFAQAKSPDAKIARSTYKSKYWQLKSLKAGFLPSINLQGFTPRLVRSIIPNINDEGTQEFITQNSAMSSLMLSIDQTIPQTGSRLSIRSGLDRIDDFGSNGTPASVFWNATPIEVGISQPILQFNSQKWSRKLLPMEFNIAEIRYIEAREDIAIAVAGKFFDAFISKIQLENDLLNIAVNDTIYKILRGRFNVGKIAENDLLQGELAWLQAQSQAARSKLDMEQNILDLIIMLGLTHGTVLEILPPDVIQKVEVDRSFAVREAVHNRSDMVNYDYQLQTAERDLVQTKYQNRFQFDLVANFGLNQQGSTLSEAFVGPLSTQDINIGFNIPIFEWGRARADIQSAIEQKKQTHIQVALDKRKLAQEVGAESVQFMLLQQQVVISAKADTIAQRRFEVAKNRYLIGKITITDLQIAQDEKDSSRRNYIETLKNYWTGYYRLRRLTLYDFLEDRRIEPPSIND